MPHAQPIVFTCFMCPPALVMLHHHNQPPNCMRFCSSLQCQLRHYAACGDEAGWCHAAAIHVRPGNSQGLSVVTPCMFVRQAL